MFVDLNIAWPTNHLNYLISSTSNSKKGKHKASNQPSSSNQNSVDVWKGISDQEKKDLKDTVDCAIRLGYSVIAFNLVIPQNLDPTHLSPHFPFTAENPPFPELDPRTSTKQNGYQGTALQLSRLTMVMDEKVTGGGKGVFGFSASQSAYLSRYSLLSVIPLDSAAFSHACLSLSPPSPTGIDLITLDLASSPRLPFHMPLSTVSQAMKYSVHFELIYSPATSGNRYTSYSPSNFPVITSSNSSRKNMISGAKDLIRVTKSGKGLVISSAAKNWTELRAGDDLVNLVNVLGLSQEYGRRSITMNPKGVVTKALSTRKTHKGVISNPVIVTKPVKNDQQAHPVPSDTTDKIKSPIGSKFDEKRDHSNEDPQQDAEPRLKKKKT